MRRSPSQILPKLKLKPYVSLFQVTYSSVGESAWLNSVQVHFTVLECAGHI